MLSVVAAAVSRTSATSNASTYVRIAVTSASGEGVRAPEMGVKAVVNACLGELAGLAAYEEKISGGAPAAGRRGCASGTSQLHWCRSRGGSSRGRRRISAESMLGVVAAANARAGASSNALTCVHIGVTSASGIGVKYPEAGVGGIGNASTGGVRRAHNVCRGSQRRRHGGAGGVLATQLH